MLVWQHSERFSSTRHCRSHRLWLRSATAFAIPVKRFDRVPVSYLSQEEITAVLDAPDRSSWSGHRDAVMLATMYNTGARVSEIIRLNVEDLQMGPTAT